MIQSCKVVRSDVLLFSLFICISIPGIPLNKYGKSNKLVALIDAVFHSFQTFLGQKYGYRPFPAKIVASEFEKLLGAVESNDDLQLLKHWFWRDDNSVPAEYLLQPITSLLPHYRDYANDELRKKASSDWWTAFERMQVVLRLAADKALDKKERHKYYMSGMTQKTVLQRRIKLFFMPLAIF